MKRTLQQYLLEELANHPMGHDIVLMMSDFATIGKMLSEKVNRAGLIDVLGATGEENVQGEEVQKLDVVANNLCKTYLAGTGHYAAMASEEEDDVVVLNDSESAEYVVAFDPLDGSSNIDVNVSIGTIFSVHKRIAGAASSDTVHFLQAGRDQVFAGYVLYGSSTVLVFSWGNGVHEFTLDPNIGEFFLSKESIRLPDTCGIYSVNESNKRYMQEKDVAFINELQTRMSSRYIGSLVADFHRNLLKGGIFLYPAIDKKGSGEFKGKLRVNFELKPMAFLLAHSGGLAIDGKQDIVDVLPTSLHERVPVIMGNTDVVSSYLS